MVVVDFSQPIAGQDNTYKAVKREWAIIGDTEGDSMDAYTYSGNMRATSKRIKGTATTSSNDSVATFTADSSL